MDYKKKNGAELAEEILRKSGLVFIEDTDTTPTDEGTRFANPTAQRDKLAQSVCELHKTLLLVYGVKDLQVWAISPFASAESLAETNRILRGAIMNAFGTDERKFSHISNTNDEGEIIDALEDTKEFINDVVLTSSFMDDVIEAEAETKK
ncbi:MAG: hypothetical protein IJP62_06710 [Treponema sp.]|nr:hypothetical protein [Treponema sp.]